MRRRRLLFGLPLLALTPARASAPGFMSGTPLDVAVIGAGLAGLSAAVAASEAGAKRITVFEKEAVVGGHTAVSTGYFSAVVRKPGRPEAEYRRAVGSMAKDMMETGKGFGNPVLIRRLVEESGEAVRWLSEKGVVWLPDTYQALGGMSPRSYISSFVRGGYDFIYALSREAKRRGIEIRFSSPATGLGIEGSSGLFRVDYSSENGADAVLAKSVILATGGYTDSVELRSQYDPRLTAAFTTTANPYGEGVASNTGDGLLLAQRLGADAVDLDQILTIPFSGGRLTNYVGADIYLNEQGHRFVNEAASMEDISEAVWSLPNQTFWVLTDAQSAKGASRNVKLINGIVKTAGTLYEAAREMGIDADVLEEEIRAYNQCARTKEDPLFHRTIFTQEIKKPPFYFGRERPFIHFCNGGIRFDAEARVLKKDGSAIPGLFAAGEVTGGVHGHGRLGGTSLPDCVVYGRIAGRNAARRAAGKA